VPPTPSFFPTYTFPAPCPFMCQLHSPRLMPERLLMVCFLRRAEAAHTRCLVLDLDETLVHTEFNVCRPSHLSPALEHPPPLPHISLTHTSPILSVPLLSVSLSVSLPLALPGSLSPSRFSFSLHLPTVRTLAMTFSSLRHLWQRFRSKIVDGLRTAGPTSPLSSQKWPRIMR
jgi:hypothetical protein